MKKILHISKYYYPFSGGTEQIARDSVLALKGSYDQKVICFNDANTDAADYVDDVEVIRCAGTFRVSSQSISLSYKKALHNLMASFRPDIIIFHYPNPFVARLLLSELKNSQAKLVIYWHLDIVKQKFLRLFFKGQNKRLIARANKVVATSPNYIEGSPWLSSIKYKCVLIPNCINVDRMKITPPIEEKAAQIRSENNGKTICLAIGRHTEYKGFKYLIQASHLLDESFAVYLIGKGSLTDELHKEAAGDSKIIFTGEAELDEMKAMLLAADIFCFPSITKNEAFGVVLAEAMYLEKPAITFTIEGSGVNYVSINGETGIEVENRNVEAFAEAMRTLSEDEELRKKYGQAGRKRVERLFLSTDFAKNIRNLINGL